MGPLTPSRESLQNASGDKRTPPSPCVPSAALVLGAVPDCSACSEIRVSGLVGNRRRCALLDRRTWSESWRGELVEEERSQPARAVQKDAQAAQLQPAELELMIKGELGRGTAH